MRALLASLLLATAALAQPGGQTRLLQLQYGTDRLMNGNLQNIEAAVCAGNAKFVCAAIQAVQNVQGAPINAPGDGSDVTLTLREAFQQPNVHFYFPAGVYVLSPQLPLTDNSPMVTLKSGQTIECEPGAVFKYADGAYDGTNRGRMFSNLDAAGNVTPVTNVRFLNCTFDGNCRGNPATCGIGLFPPHVPVTELVAVLRGQNVRAEGNYFFDVAGVGFAYYTGVDVHFDHNTFYDVGQGLSSDAVQCNGCQDFSLNGNTLLNTAEGLIAQSSTATAAKEGNGATKTLTSDGTINNNTNITLAANGICQSAGVPFACCSGEKAGNSTGLCAAGTSGGGAVIVVGQRITVSGNVITNGNTINIESGRGFETRDVNVIGNTMTNGHSNCMAAFVINAGGVGEQDIHDVHFVGNLCDGVSAPGTLGSAVYIAAGLNNSAYNITVDSNMIVHPSFCGVYMQYTEASGTGQIHDIDIRSNHFLDVCKGFAGTICGAIYMNDNTSPAFDHVTIASNYFKDSTKYLLWEEGTQTHQRILDNDLFNPDGAGKGVLNAVLSASIELWKNNFTDSTNQFVSGTTPNFSSPLFGSGGKIVTDDAFPIVQTTANHALFNVADGSRFYCTDCSAGTPCTGSGNGAWADRIHGAWDCHL